MNYKKFKTKEKRVESYKARHLTKKVEPKKIKKQPEKPGVKYRIKLEDLKKIFYIGN